MTDWMEHDKPNPIPHDGWSTMTSHEHNIIILYGILLVVIFLLRNTPLGFLWKWFKIFMIVLFATLLADHIKKDVKAWWNKD
jgi:hypothetical protein